MLGKKQDADLYLGRAANYKRIYDPTVKSMRARQRDGAWLDWKGELEFGQGCTESNPLQQSWFVPHDVYGLISLMGKERFTSSLESLFENTPKSFGWNPYYNHSNEPVHHIAYLFAYAGKPWLTQKWVRRILDEAYHAEVNGICGNDDVGQMSWKQRLYSWISALQAGDYPARSEMACRIPIHDRCKGQFARECLCAIGANQRQRTHSRLDHAR
jgi:putative alpha-1,2-mannosidase